MKKQYKEIYNLLKTIPPGKVATYGQISHELKLNNPRLVGNALHNNPDPKTIPCHRVVNSMGMVAKNFAFGGYLKQIELLKDEGVESDNGKVDLQKYRIALRNN